MREAECLVEGGLELLSARIKSVDRQGKNQERSERFKSASERRRANKKSGYRSYRSRRRRWKGDMNGKSGNPLDLATLPSPLLLLFASVLILSFSASTFPFFPTYLQVFLLSFFFFLSLYLLLLSIRSTCPSPTLPQPFCFYFLLPFLSRLYISSPCRTAIHPSSSESLFSFLSLFSFFVLLHFAFTSPSPISLFFSRFLSPFFFNFHPISVYIFCVFPVPSSPRSPHSTS